MPNAYYNFSPSFVPGTKVRSDQVNTQYQAIETAFDLLPASTTSLTQGTATLGIESGSGNSYVVTMPNTRISNAEGDEVIFRATHTNTAAATLNVDTIGAVPLAQFDGTPLVAGDIVTGRVYEFRFDDTNTLFVLSQSTDGANQVLYAEEWAINPLNVAVSIAAGGDGVTTFSALHWATLSGTSAQGMIFQGSHDATGDVAPTTPPVGRTDMYRISGAGTFDSVVYVIDDETYYDGTVWRKVGSQPAAPNETTDTTAVAGNDWFEVANGVDLTFFAAGAVEVVVATDGSGGTDDPEPVVLWLSKNDTDLGTGSLRAQVIRAPGQTATGITGYRVRYDAALDQAFLDVFIAATVTNVSCYVREPLTFVGSPHGQWTASIPGGIASAAGVVFSKLFDVRNTHWGIQSFRNDFWYEGNDNAGSLYVENFSGTSQVFTRRVSGNDNTPAAQLDLQFNGGTTRFGGGAGIGAIDIQSVAADSGIRFILGSETIEWEGSNPAEIRTIAGEFIIRNLGDGNVTRFDGEDAGAVLRDFFLADPDAEVQIFSPAAGASGAVVLETRVSGIAVRGSLAGDPGLSGTQNANITFRNLGGTDVGSINYLSTTDMHIRNVVHGGSILLQSEDASGVLQDIINGDPDGVTSVFANGLVGFQAQTGGVISLRSAGNTDTENRRLDFDFQNDVQRGFVGYDASATLRLQNEIDGAPITIQGRDAGSVSRILFSADPDSNAQLFQVGLAVARTLTAAAGGLEANNTLTGSGFERVLTISDLIPTEGTFVPTFTGFSTAPTSPVVRWSIDGNVVTVQLQFTTGTSNATGFTITNVPAAIQPDNDQEVGIFGAIDNGANINGCTINIGTGATWFFGAAHINPGGGGWTAANNKGLAGNDYIFTYILATP